MAALASYPGVIPGNESSSALDGAREHRSEPPVDRARRQDRGEPLAAVDGCLVRRAPRLEELHELLARAVFLPLAIALDDLDQVVDRLRPAPLAVERDREIEPRLMVEWIGCNLLLELCEGTYCLGLFGEIE